MKRKIALLRGINVGGKRKIIMADLKTLCQKLDWHNVQTYIQSGNIIFESNANNTTLEKVLENTIKEQYGFDVPVIVINAEKLQAEMLKNPFYADKANSKRLYITFLKDKPTAKKLEKIAKYNYEPDKFELINKSIFIYCEGKYHLSKLNTTFFEKKLGVIATTRNWKTVLKLVMLSKLNYNEC